MHKTICSNYNSSFIWLEVKGPPLRQRDLCAAALPAGWWQLGQPRSLPGQVWTRKCFSSGFAVFLILHFCMDSKFGEWNNHSWFVQKDFNLFEVGGKDAEPEPAFLCLKIHSQQRNFCGISSPVAWKQDWIQRLMNQSKMVLRSNPETLLEKKITKNFQHDLYCSQVIFSLSQWNPRSSLWKDCGNSKPCCFYPKLCGFLSVTLLCSPVRATARKAETCGYSSQRWSDSCCISAQLCTAVERNAITPHHPADVSLFPLGMCLI